MNINASGIITKPLQPAFQAQNASTQSNIATSTQVAVALGSERIDRNADFASSIFTAPVTGVYQLQAYIRLDNIDSAAAYYEFKINTSNSGYGIIFDPDFGQDNTYQYMAFAITLTVEVTDTEQAILLNDLLSIDDWLQAAMLGKKNNCWKRMQQEWTTKLMNDDSFTDSIPSNQADFVALVTARSDYQTRTERDAASSIG